MYFCCNRGESICHNSLNEGGITVVSYKNTVLDGCRTVSVYSDGFSPNQVILSCGQLYLSRPAEHISHHFTIKYLLDVVNCICPDGLRVFLTS